MGLGVDRFDDQAGIRLTVAESLALIGFGLVLVDTDFLAEAMLLDFAVDGSPFHERRAHFDGFPTDEEDLVKLDILPGST